MSKRISLAFHEDLFPDPLPPTVEDTASEPEVIMVNATDLQIICSALDLICKHFRLIKKDVSFALGKGDGYISGLTSRSLKRVPQSELEAILDLFELTLADFAQITDFASLARYEETIRNVVAKNELRRHTSRVFDTHNYFL